MTLKPSSVSILQIPTVTGMLFATTEYWRLIHKMVSALLFVTLTYEWSEVDASSKQSLPEVHYLHIRTQSRLRFPPRLSLSYLTAVHSGGINRQAPGGL